MGQLNYSSYWQLNFLCSHIYLASRLVSTSPGANFRSHSAQQYLKVGKLKIYHQILVRLFAFNSAKRTLSLDKYPRWNQDEFELFLQLKTKIWWVIKVYEIDIEPDWDSFDTISFKHKFVWNFRICDDQLIRKNVMKYELNSLSNTTKRSHEKQILDVNFSGRVFSNERITRRYKNIFKRREKCILKYHIHVLLHLLKGTPNGLRIHNRHNAGTTEDVPTLLPSRSDSRYDGHRQHFQSWSYGVRESKRNGGPLAQELDQDDPKGQYTLETEGKV